MKTKETNLENFTINVNGTEMPLELYKLIFCIRDVKLWIAGIKPHRNFRISDVKNYFGVKGSPQKVLEQLQQLKAQYEA